MQDEVKGQLARFRETTSALRQKVDAYNDEHGRPPEVERVSVYFGQSAIEEENETP